MTRRWTVTAVALGGLLGLCGCMEPPKTLYYWGDYQAQVYDNLQHPDAGAVTRQVLALEENIQKAAAENRALPPGFHAHLGMLYYAQGQVGKSAEQFELERAKFPESGIIVERMLARFKQ